MTDRPLVIVSKSEPDDAVAKLGVYGINAVPGEVGSDYVWYPHGQTFAIERKTTSNLLGSLKDRQLVEQAQRGVQQFNRYFLLVEGDYRRDATGKFSYYAPNHPGAGRDGYVISGFQFEAIDGMLFDLGLLGVQLVRCDLYDYARKVASVVINTSSESHAFLRERQRPDLPASVALGGKQYEDVVWSLCALPGVGPELAMALLQEYGTLADAILALKLGPNAPAYGPVDPATVRINGKRLGDKRAARIREAVTQNWNGGIR